MGLFGSSANAFPWVKLTSLSQLDELIGASEDKPVLLFKHSTACNISAMVLSRFEKNWHTDADACTCVYLDLRAHRDISNAIAEKTGVWHESPQVLLLKNRQAVYDASHGGIDASYIQTLL
jgi:bacillithiol system protein YtxJ